MEECLFIIDYGILPEAGMGRADLPLEVGTWLRPVHAAMNKSIRERAKTGRD